MESNLSEAEIMMNAKILKLTTTIRTKYPELIKYLDEMPITIPNKKHPDVGIKSLTDYYDSLNAILNRYFLDHPSKKDETLF
jgi:hypothetical protein